MGAAGPYELRSGMWVVEARGGAGADHRLLAAIPEAGLTDDELVAALSHRARPTTIEAIVDLTGMDRDLRSGVNRTVSKPTSASCA